MFVWPSPRSPIGLFLYSILSYLAMMLLARLRLKIIDFFHDRVKAEEERLMSEPRQPPRANSKESIELARQLIRSEPE